MKRQGTNLEKKIYNKILLGYIHYMGGFVVTFPIRFILYIIYIALIVSPPQPPPYWEKNFKI
jgi:hypothetical protein